MPPTTLKDAPCLQAAFKGMGKALLAKLQLAAAKLLAEANTNLTGRAPPPRTKWTRRVPHPVLIGHAAPPR
jgi:hypothetical protein